MLAQNLMMKMLQQLQMVLKRKKTRHLVAEDQVEYSTKACPMQHLWDLLGSNFGLDLLNHLEGLLVGPLDVDSLRIY